MSCITDGCCIFWAIFPRGCERGYFIWNYHFCCKLEALYPWVQLKGTGLLIADASVTFLPITRKISLRCAKGWNSGQLWDAWPGAGRWLADIHGTLEAEEDPVNTSQENNLELFSCDDLRWKPSLETDILHTGRIPPSVISDIDGAPREKYFFKCTKIGEVHWCLDIRRPEQMWLRHYTTDSSMASTVQHWKKDIPPQKLLFTKDIDIRQTYCQNNPSAPMSNFRCQGCSQEFNEKTRLRFWWVDWGFPIGKMTAKSFNISGSLIMNAVSANGRPITKKSIKKLWNWAKTKLSARKKTWTCERASYTALNRTGFLVVKLTVNVT